MVGMKKLFSLEKGRHWVGESCYHLVFVVAYRRKIFTRDKVLQLTQAYIEVKAKDMGIRIETMEFDKDHVHMFVSRCDDYSPRQMKRLIKGFVSKMMRKNHKALFCDMLWGKKFWKRGDFHRSIGSVTKDKVRFYIDHCQGKYWSTP
jgi:putative transposase